MMMASISPSPAASEQQDLPSPGVGEDFDLRRRLNKSWKKYGVPFLTKRRLSYIGKDETIPEVPESPGGAAYRWGHATTDCPRGSPRVIPTLSVLLVG
jgi:hypothetical protein